MCEIFDFSDIGKKIRFKFEILENLQVISHKKKSMGITCKMNRKNFTSVFNTIFFIGITYNRDDEWMMMKKKINGNYL